MLGLKDIKEKKSNQRKIYRIDEEEKSYNWKDAINAVVDAGIFDRDDIDESRCLTRVINGWNIGLVSKKPSGNKDENLYALYSFNAGKLMLDEPICGMTRCGNSNRLKDRHWIIKKFDENGDEKYNILTEDGVVFDEFVGYIALDRNGNYDFIVADNADDGLYSIYNIDGTKKTKEPFEDLKFLSDTVTIGCRTNDQTYTIFDKDMNVLLEGVVSYDDYEYEYEEDVDSGKTVYIYVIEVVLEGKYGKTRSIYRDDMTLICDDILNVDARKSYREQQIFVLENGDCRQNVLGRDGKLMFDEWVDTIEDHPGYNDGHFDMAHLNNKYKLILNTTLEPLGDVWYDEIVFIDHEVLGYSGLIAMMKDGKCNIMMGDPDSDSYMDFMFDEPVDDISINGNIMIVTIKGQEYLYWNGGRLLNIKFDNIYETGNEECYVVMCDDGKMDIIKTDEEDTFCEKYLNGRHLDMCADFMSDYPYFSIDGKYNYADLDSFVPAFYGLASKKFRWFDDVECAEYDEDEHEYYFDIVENGEKKRIGLYDD